MTKEEIVFYINGIRESIESKLRASASLGKLK